MIFIFCYIMGGGSALQTLSKGSYSVFGEKEKLRVLCYDKWHLKPARPEKVWISPPPTSVGCWVHFEHPQVFIFRGCSINSLVIN